MPAQYWNPAVIGTICGGIMVIAGLIGFVPNPFAGPGALFEANTLHNIIHLVTGSAAILAARAGYGLAALWGLSVFYIGFSTLGFFNGPEVGITYIGGSVSINWADNFLHAALTGGFLLAAIVLTGDRLARPRGRISG